MKALSIALATLTLLLAGPADSAGASDFKAGVDGSGTCLAPGPSPSFGSWNSNTSGTGASSALAVTTGGAISVTGSASSDGQTPGFNSNFACFKTELVLDDVVLTGPDPTAVVQASADLAGLLSLSGVNRTDSTVSITISIELGEDSGSGVVFSAGSLSKISLGTYGAPFDGPISSSLTTQPITVSTSSTLAVRMKLSGKFNARDNWSPGSANTSVELSWRLRAPTVGPVFTLPAGFTANSVDGHVVNNQFDVGAAVPVAYCTAGTSASGCTALLSTAGMPSATAPFGFTLSASGVEGNKDGLYFVGTSGGQANPWGNGTSFQCVVPPVKRLGLLTGAGTPGQCDGAFSQDLNATWCPSFPTPSKNPGAGVVAQAQLWYRDPLSTSNQSTSLSDAVEFVVTP